MTKDWWMKNIGGVLATSSVALVIYALGSYISSSIAKEMKGYVPVSVWTQWAQERGEWRGKVDQELLNLKAEQWKQRDDILRELRDTGKQVAAQTVMIQELKEALKTHITLPTNP